MPEMPEVENVRATLQELVPGKKNRSSNCSCSKNDCINTTR